MTELEARIIRIEQMLDLYPVKIPAEKVQSIHESGVGFYDARNIVKTEMIENEFKANMEQAIKEAKIKKWGAKRYDN